MDIDYLREMIILADKKSYAATAEELFISQSALSRHVVLTENKLGVQLFHRNSRRVQLSKYGELLLPYARKIIDLEAEYKAVIAEAIRVEKGGLCFGSFAGLSTFGIMSQIAEFLSMNRKVSVSIIRKSTDELRNMLRVGKCDFIFMQEASPNEDDGFSRITVAVDRLVMVLPNTHPLSDKPTIGLSQLQNDYFILQPSRPFLHRKMIDAFRKASFTPNEVPILAEGVGVLELVENGMGVSMELEMIARDKNCRGIALVPLEQPERIWINMLWVPELLTPIGKAFVAHMLDRTNSRMVCNLK